MSSSPAHPASSKPRVPRRKLRNVPEVSRLVHEGGDTRPAEDVAGVTRALGGPPQVGALGAPVVRHQHQLRAQGEAHGVDHVGEGQQQQTTLVEKGEGGN